MCPSFYAIVLARSPHKFDPSRRRGSQTRTKRRAAANRGGETDVLPILLFNEEEPGRQGEPGRRAGGVPRSRQVRVGRIRPS